MRRQQTIDCDPPGHGPRPAAAGAVRGLARATSLRGDLGKSVFSKLPVSQLIGQRAPATLELAIAGEILTILIALPLGVIAAVKQRTPADWGISSAISLGLAVPNFWLGILLILLFAVALGLAAAGRARRSRADPAGRAEVPGPAGVHAGAARRR